MKLLVFDIGGTEIKYSIMDETLSMEHSGHVPTPIDSFESFSKIICDIYQEYKEEVEGIAMSILGFVDSKNFGNVMKKQTANRIKYHPTRVL